MAIYHLHAKIIQRSKGKNAVAAAAYRRATKLFDEKEGRNWDYTSKCGVIHSELLIPENAPDWVCDLVKLHDDEPCKASEILWNTVEAAEKRVDSQLAREIEFSLPIELTESQNIKLAQEFIHDQFVLRGMIADWSVHWDEGNPHVHVMLTMRELNTGGFGKRVLEWNNRAYLHEWRKQWAEYANFHLRLHQHDVKIDHRSYEEQGINLIPTIHQGKAVTDMHSRGIHTDLMLEANAIRRDNLNRISQKPEILFNKLSTHSNAFSGHQIGHELGRYINDQGKYDHHNTGALDLATLLTLEEFELELQKQRTLTPEIIAKILKSIELHESVFTEKALVKAVASFTNNAEQFAKAIIQLKASDELIPLGVGDDGHDRFTTRKMFKIENNIQHLADTLNKHIHVEIAPDFANSHLQQYEKGTGKMLTHEQKQAVQHVLSSSSVSCLVGRAGTGKSFSLGAAKAVWEAKGLRVQGVALSGVAADGLSKDTGMPSRTIESFRYAIEKGAIILNENDVIVMDEAGMSDSLSMQCVLTAVQHARAKVVLVGDHAQLQPVGPGACFRALIERLGFAEIQTIYRQKMDWQREATIAFSAGDIVKGLAAYESQGCIHYCKTDDEAKVRLVNDWFVTRENTGADLSALLVLAHRNDDVNAINEVIRSARVQRGEIASGYTVETTRGQLNIAQGDRILFLKNDRKLGVSNGRFAEIKQVNFSESGNVIDFTATLDGNQKEVKINPAQYRDFAHGYAATIHKVQGVTVDHAFVFAGGTFWNRNLTYVALSRHRDSCHLYASRETHHEKLYYNLGRLSVKDSVLDFPVQFSERRGLDISDILSKISLHVGERLGAVKDWLSGKLDWLDRDVGLDSEQGNKDYKMVLTKFVDLELEKTKLIKAMHARRVEDPALGRELSKQIKNHAEKIKSFVAEAVNDTQLKLEIEKLNRMKPPSLAERGGYSRIRDQLNINKGQWSKQDELAVITQIRNQSRENERVTARAQEQDRGRGGRSL